MKKRILWIVGLIIVCLAGWAFISRGRKAEPEIEYRYEKVEVGTLTRSISATGLLEARTSVDVKSKAGGRVVRLAVDIGAPVKAGQLIAEIDPSDTKAQFDQAAADVQSAQARAAQAQTNYRLQIQSSSQGVQDARIALQQAQTRLERIRLQAQRQPTLTSSSIASAQSGYDAALAAQRRLQEVTIPQMRREAEGALNAARANQSAAEANFGRQQQLLEKGYVAQAAVDTARSQLEAARSEFNTRQQRVTTLDREIAAEEQVARTETERARATLQQARAARTEPQVARTNVSEAEEAVRQARVALQRAQSEQLNNQVRQQEVVAAQASTVRSRVSLQNAKVQLESTTVVAPRSGVVTQKYLEEGTIIPPGTSTFSQGTSLVQIADTSEMYVQCAVDEADIGNVELGQRVFITTEAYPRERLRGSVDRISPAAATNQNVTAVQVRVKITPGFDLPIKPGMNATCEFITMRKPDVLIAPSQAIRRGPDGPYVLVKGPDPKHPVQRPVKTGEVGNDGTEITEGLKEDEEIVTAEVNIAQLKEIQQQMQTNQEGGGLASGIRGPRGAGGNRGGATGGRAGAGGGGGGNRAGGGGRG